MANEKPKQEEIPSLNLTIDTIVEMLIKGCSRADIIRYSEQTWSATEGDTDLYIARALKKIKATNILDIEDSLELAIARYNDLYKKNYQIQDYRECRAVQDILNKLLAEEVRRKEADKRKHSPAWTTEKGVITK